MTRKHLSGGTDCITCSGRGFRYHTRARPHFLVDERTFRIELIYVIGDMLRMQPWALWAPCRSCGGTGERRDAA